MPCASFPLNPSEDVTRTKQLGLLAAALDSGDIATKPWQEAATTLPDDRLVIVLEPEPQVLARQPGTGRCHYFQ